MSGIERLDVEWWAEDKQTGVGDENIDELWPVVVAILAAVVVGDHHWSLVITAIVHKTTGG